MGAILSHGYVPLYVAKTLIAELLCEPRYFLGYIDATESEAVIKYLATSQDNAYLLQEVIIPRFNCCTNSSPSNCKQVIININTAHCALLCLPYLK